MSLKSGYLSGRCPNCNTLLDYAAAEASVFCHSCKRAVAVKDILPLGKAGEGNPVAPLTSELSESVISARAALIYLNNLFEGLDWERFALTPDLTIPEADALARIALLKFSDDPISYVLDFRRIAIPMFKRIEMLGMLEVKIIEHYKKDDISDLFEYVDLYSSVTSEIVEKRDGMIAALDADLRLAERFGADEALILDLKKSSELFRNAIIKVSASTDIESVPGYVRAKELYDARLSDKLEAIGIDAEATYRKAAGMMADGHVDGALHLYHLLGEYKNSAKIVRKHSSFFEFCDLFEAAGHTYTVRNKKSSSSSDGASVFSLYEANSALPAMSEVSRIIATWGTRIFFMRRDEQICCLDTRSSELYANVLIMDSASAGDYAIDKEHPIYFSRDRSQFFLRKAIKTPKTKRDRKSMIGNRDNNYSVIRIDMDEMTQTTVIPEVVDVMDFCDDRLFYTTIDKSGEASFHVLSLSDGKDETLLNTECVIHKVIDDLIIYSVWAPSRYNVNLYSVSVNRKVPILLAQNTSGYYTSYEGRIFYTVGSGDNTRLYSVTPDGKDRCEITASVGKITDLRSGWIYYVSGDDRNACLMKVSTDGQRRVTVASRFKRLLRMTNGYIYYISTADDLTVVRSDGNGEKVIAHDVDGEDMIIDDSHIYYLRREYVGDESTNTDGMGKSLYVTDLTGKGLRKIAHNVSAMKEYSEGAIQITSETVNDYVITTPTGAKKTRVEYVTKNVINHELLDKATGERTLIMQIGAPEVEYVFLGKKKKLASTVENVTVRRGYKRLGTAERGHVRDVEIEARSRKAKKNRRHGQNNVKEIGIGTGSDEKTDTGTDL